MHVCIYNYIHIYNMYINIIYRPLPGAQGCSAALGGFRAFFWGDVSAGVLLTMMIMIYEYMYIYIYMNNNKNKNITK